MKVLRVLVIAGVLTVSAAFAPLLRGRVAQAEELTLDTPVARGNRTTWTLIQVHINYELPEVTMVLRDPGNGDLVTCVEGPATAQAFIRSFNDDDLTANSLQKRMFTEAQANACIGAGTVGGAPY